LRKVDGAPVRKSMDESRADSRGLLHGDAGVGLSDV
jgi:hypothetical protein